MNRPSGVSVMDSVADRSWTPIALQIMPIPAVSSMERANRSSFVYNGHG